MSETQRSLTYTDPRYIDGDPFEVARAAALQAEGVVELAERAVEDATIMARNAEMERQLYDADECDASGWPESPQGAKFEQSRWALNNVKMTLRMLAKAAGFNPRKLNTQETLTNGN